MASAGPSGIYLKVFIQGFHYQRRELVKFEIDGSIGEGIAALIPDTESSVISHVTAIGTKDPTGITIQIDTPVRVINELGYNGLNVFLTKKESTDENNNSTNNNVLNVLMNVNKIYNRLPEKRVERTEKDRMYNHILTVLRERKIGFTPIQVEKTGKRVLDSLTSTMWFADGRWDKFERRGIDVPEMFKEVTGYRNLYARPA